MRKRDKLIDALEKRMQQAKPLGADPEPLLKVKELRAILEESLEIAALEN